MVKTTKDRKVKDPIRNVPLKLEVIDEGADHTDNVKKEYELCRIPTERHEITVLDAQKKPKVVTVKKIMILRNNQGIIFGHRGFW